MMRKLLSVLAVGLLCSLSGCMCYLTHKEMGCRKLWSFDVESVPTNQPAQTTPFHATHHWQHKMKDAVPGAVPMAKAPVETLVIYEQAPPKAKLETIAPPVAEKIAVPDHP